MSRPPGKYEPASTGAIAWRAVVAILAGIATFVILLTILAGLPGNSLIQFKLAGTTSFFVAALVATWLFAGVNVLYSEPPTPKEERSFRTFKLVLYLTVFVVALSVGA